MRGVRRPHRRQRTDRRLGGRRWRHRTICGVPGSPGSISDHITHPPHCPRCQWRQHCSPVRAAHPSLRTSALARSSRPSSTLRRGCAHAPCTWPNGASAPPLRGGKGSTRRAPRWALRRTVSAYGSPHPTLQGRGEIGAASGSAASLPSALSPSSGLDSGCPRDDHVKWTKVEESGL